MLPWQQQFAFLPIPIYFPYQQTASEITGESESPQILSSGSSSDKENDGMQEALEQVYETKDWFPWEEGVWVRSFCLPLLDQCYIEGDDSGHQPR